MIRDIVTCEARCVLDTKYKQVDPPSTSDIAQVVAYAEATGCHDALLVYPAAPQRPLDAVIGDVRVQSVVFDLAERVKIVADDDGRMDTRYVPIESLERRT